CYTTPTQDKTFKQLKEERLGWEVAQRLQAQELADLEKQRTESLMKDANLARQMFQEFEMTEDQRKRQQEVLASATNYSDAAWDIILARLQANFGRTNTPGVFKTGSYILFLVFMCWRQLVDWLYVTPPNWVTAE
ncbi:hypothetical protein Tco_0354252, partial [Tanacetum coccineum]